MTPLLFKLIPAVAHLGVLLRWFPPDSSVEVYFIGCIIILGNTGYLSFVLKLPKICFGLSDWDQRRWLPIRQR